MKARLEMYSDLTTILCLSPILLFLKQNITALLFLELSITATTSASTGV